MEFSGSGLDMKEKFGKSEVVEVIINEKYLR